MIFHGHPPYNGDADSGIEKYTSPAGFSGPSKRKFFNIGVCCISLSILQLTNEISLNSAI